MMKSLTPIAALLALSVSGAALADNHAAPAEGMATATEGKCGGMKTEEGKCGAKQAEEAKCGAKKADEGKCGAKKGMKEGKCGEGHCGGKK